MSPPGSEQHGGGSPASSQGAAGTGGGGDGTGQEPRPPPGRDTREGSRSWGAFPTAARGQAWSRSSPSATFCDLQAGQRGQSPAGRAPVAAFHRSPGAAPSNNESLSCLCLSFWQRCSFQVLLITALLATRRVSIAGWALPAPFLSVQPTPARPWGAGPYLQGWCHQGAGAASPAGRTGLLLLQLELPSAMPRCRQELGEDQGVLLASPNPRLLGGTRAALGTRAPPAHQRNPARWRGSLLKKHSQRGAKTRLFLQNVPPGVSCQPHRAPPCPPQLEEGGGRLHTKGRGEGTCRTDAGEDGCGKIPQAPACCSSVTPRGRQEAL